MKGKFLTHKVAVETIPTLKKVKNNHLISCILSLTESIKLDCCTVPSKYLIKQVDIPIPIEIEIKGSNELENSNKNEFLTSLILW